MAKPPYDRPFVNSSGEQIPAWAVMEVGGWVDDSEGVSVFAAVKPTKDGRLYLLNGPVPINPGRRGWAAANAFGLWALYTSNGTPQLNQEFGPSPGSWALSASGSGGFVIVDDPRGVGASLPGFPASASTKRIRVSEKTRTEQANRIQGTVAQTVTVNMPTFAVNQITVLSGKDPRNNPGNPLELVTIQNVPRRAYANGVDRITASQSKSDLLWYPEAGGSGANRMQGYLAVDLTTSMAKVAVLPERYTGSPKIEDGRVEVFNPVDKLNGKPFVFAGKRNAFVTATEFDAQWWLDGVQAGPEEESKPYGLLVGTAPAAEPKINKTGGGQTTGGEILPGYSPDAVIPLTWEGRKLISGAGADSTVGKLPVLNPLYQQKIIGSETTERLVIVKGSQQLRMVGSSDAGAEERLAYVIESVVYPIVIVTGTAQQSVTGGQAFTFRVSAVIWGRPIVKAGDQFQCGNSGGFGGPNGGYAVACYTNDGGWHCLDLACPTEET